MNRCSIDGCSLAAWARGWCPNHYYRWRKHGDPLGGSTIRGARMRWLRAAFQRETDACITDWPFSKTAGYPSINTRSRPGLANRLLCEWAHGPAPSEGLHAAHSCGDRGCLNKRHLRWATPAENNEDKIAHGSHRDGERVNFAKLTADQVVLIRCGLEDGETQTALAREFGVSPSTISRIASGHNWKMRSRRGAMPSS